MATAVPLTVRSLTAVAPPNEDYRGRSLLYTQQVSPEWCEMLFSRARRFQELVEAEDEGRLKWWTKGFWELKLLRRQMRHKLLYTFFYEESTRTRISFETAAVKLGMRVISTPNAKFSSVSKGESIPHTMKMLSGYRPAAIVMRHHTAGSVEVAARASSKPVINAGDGIGQHPTQALLDLYTIKQQLGRLEGLTVALIGDLMNGRTVHSLVYLLGQYPGTRFIFVSPGELKIAEKIKNYLIKHGIPFEETEDLRYAMEQADVVYATRVQKERFKKPGSQEIDLERYKRVAGRFRITLAEMSWMKSHAILMHPLPINSEDPDVEPEIAPEVDDHPQQRYIIQAHNGLYVRMALLEYAVLHKGFQDCC